MLFGSDVYSELMFGLFAVVAVIPCLFILFGQDIVRQAFWLLFSLSGFAGLYFCLGADFLGFTQVIVYIGGILILFLFGVMLTHRADVAIKAEAGMSNVGAGVAAGTLATALLLYTIWTTPWKENPRVLKETVTSIGEKVMSTFILPFEVVSVLLLVALVGATYIARRKGGAQS